MSRDYCGKTGHYIIMTLSSVVNKTFTTLEMQNLYINNVHSKEVSNRYSILLTRVISN